MRRQGHDTTCPGRVGIMTTLPVSNFQFRISSFDSPSAPRSSFVLVAVPPPPFLHRRIFRFSFTRTSARNTIISKFRRLPRDSPSIHHGPFLDQLSSASSAKPAVPPPLLFLRSSRT